MTDQSTFFSGHKRLILLLAASTLLLALLFVFGTLISSRKTEPGNPSDNGQSLPAGAQTLKLASQPVTNSMLWQGTIRARLAIDIAPKVNAHILVVAVHPGDKLKKGDIIAKLDDRDLRAAYNAANAALIAAQAQASQSRTEEKRIIELYNKQAVTSQNYEAALAQAQAAQAKVDQAASTAQQSKVELGENVLYAPFDGVVGERLQEPGGMGMPNQPIITFLNPDDLRLEVAIADRCSPLVKPSMKLDVRIDAIQQTVTGTLDEVAPEIDPKTRTRLIKISLPKTNGLQHGQFGWLSLGCEAEQQALLVPASAILYILVNCRR